MRPGSSSAWANLRSDLAFVRMKNLLVQHHSEVGWRQTLSAHMTKSCGPGHKAPCESLKACGFENVMQVPDSVSAAKSQFQLHLEFPHAFTDDDEHAFSYTSGLHPTKKAAQNEAALEVLVALLVVAPKSIRMVPSCFKGCLLYTSDAADE